MITRVKSVSLTESGTGICFTSRVIAQVKDGELRLTDPTGRLRPARRADLRTHPLLTDLERHRLRNALIRQRRGGKDPFEPDLVVPIPAMGMFISRRGTSPLVKFWRWASEVAGGEIRPTDVLIACEDLNALLAMQADWLRGHGLKGKALAYATGFNDIDTGPLSAPRGRGVVPGWAFIRSTRAQGRQEEESKR